MRGFVVIPQSNLQSSKGLRELNGSLLREFFWCSVSFCVGLINATFHNCQRKLMFILSNLIHYVLLVIVTLFLSSYGFLITILHDVRTG